jgi:hypothetical protein
MSPEDVWTSVEEFLDSPLAYVVFVAISAVTAAFGLYVGADWLVFLSGLFALAFVSDLITIHVWPYVESRFQRAERNYTPPDRELTPPRVSPTTKTVVVVGTALLVLYLLVGLAVMQFV